MSTLHEPARDLPVIHEADVCVLGGSCTGLFAALRAARLGARVVIVEKDNCFGGVATTAMVNVWHSLYDTEGKNQIIAGLTEETMNRLERRNAVKRHERTNPSRGFTFNSEELKIELDELAREAGIKIYLHTQFAAPAPLHDSNGRLEAVFVENKSGRGAIRARMFIDATGDADLAARLGCETYFANHLQPATACARFSGWGTLNETNVGALIREHGPAYGLPPTFSWGNYVPNSDVYMLAATRIHGINPANADELTHGEIEGRRQVRAIADILRANVPDCRLSLEALPSRLGLRESRHIRSPYQLTGDDVLSGRAFDDTIAQGSYRVDVHHQDKPGITLRYLDGTEEFHQPGVASTRSRWRPETATNPTYYQIPYRSLLPLNGPGNVIVAGRMLDVDPIAHAAVRVMVNMNQTGEAAGVAAVLALETNTPLPSLDVASLRAKLIAGGSAL
ncbi:MAG TPA: FAD-dependent oxidoreductase [Rariglobus sp.]|nr:FAD-dependent oxidoreductase [Rariglobus sp.]